MVKLMKIVLVTFKAKNRDKEIIQGLLDDKGAVFFVDEISQDKLEEIIPQVNIILTGSGLDLKKEYLEKAENLEMIQTISAGVDYVPFKWIREDVIVCSNAGGNALAVAEHAIALLLSAAKKIVYHHENMRKGFWRRRIHGVLLRGKKLGIIGFGNIGKLVAKFAKAFEMRVLAINRSGKSDMEVDFIGTLNDLDYVLSSADFIVLALPLTKETKGLITKEKLRLMKKNAVLINVARGPIIDQKDLYEHLKSNPEFIAALDVWWEYPEDLNKPKFQKYPFHELENIIMTPHVAGFSSELREYVIRHAVENIVLFIEGKKPRNIVNRESYI